MTRQRSGLGDNEQSSGERPSSAHARRDPPANRATGLDPHHPCQVAYDGYTVLVTRPDGDFDAGSREGLFDYDCRILCRHRLTINGRSPDAVYSTVLRNAEWSSWMSVRRTGGTPEGPRLPQDVVGISMVRTVGQGMLEELTLRNHSAAPVQLELRLELDADFMDIQQAGMKDPVRGNVDRTWNAAQRRLLFQYEAKHQDHTLKRALSLEVKERGARELRFNQGFLEVSLELGPQAVWQAELIFSSLVDGEWRRPHTPGGEQAPRERLRERWRARRTELTSDSAVAAELFERAAEDLASLRNWELDVSEDQWVPNAGAPTYTGFFGRDALTAGWQALLLGPEMLRGALALLQQTQAEAFDPWRDAEPGKLIHEMRKGPLAELNLIPQRFYYGTLTTNSIFVIALSELWHWTGDLEEVRHYHDTALKALKWAERFGDRNGDGFLDYIQQSPRGLKNHGWKDSSEAIRYPDGTLVENPIATIEEQAYYFVALQRMAELLVALGEPQEASRFLERADRLKAAWDKAFWVEDDGFYAMALDPDRKPVRSIGSNAGHALAAGIIPASRARQVVDRLLADDLFSGWGIRTLSTQHPSYNPFAYHLGTVWPVENAVIALGMKRYGFDAEAEQLLSALVDAAGYYQGLRLPEAFSGLSPEESAVPVPYPMANSPQAWSASACIQMFQTLLGIQPYAPAHVLGLARPRLPPWIGQLVLKNLRVGNATVTLRFTRNEDGSASHKVLERSGSLHIVEIPPPNGPAEERDAWEELKLALLERAPGSRSRQIRIALGLED